MKKSIKKILFLVMVVALFVSASVSVSATEMYEVKNDTRESLTKNWVNATVSVPGRNGSAYSEVFDDKATDDTKASFYCTSKSNDRNFDARLVNSLKQSKSSWARNLDLNDFIYVSSSAALSHYYWCEVSSDLLTSGATTVSLAFSADKMTTFPN